AIVELLDIAERQGITSADFIHLLDSGMQISDFLAAMNPVEHSKRTLDCDSQCMIPQSDPPRRTARDKSRPQIGPFLSTLRAGNAFESARLRSTIPRRSLISRGLVGSRLSQPYSTHFSKLILVSQQKFLLAFEHGGQKMIPARKFRLEFLDGIHGRVDRAADAFLHCR